MKTATLPQVQKYLSLLDEIPVEQVQCALGSGLLTDVLKANYHENINRSVVRQALGLQRWHEQDGVIYFSVTSNGMTGEQWISHLEERGFEVVGAAKAALLSADFKPTSDVTSKIAVVRDSWRRPETGPKLKTPNAEIACLICDMFTDEEIRMMGLESICVVHEMFNQLAWDRLGVSFVNKGQKLTICGSPSEFGDAPDNFGFAYTVSET